MNKIVRKILFEVARDQRSIATIHSNPSLVDAHNETAALIEGIEELEKRIAELEAALAKAQKQN